MRGRLDDLPDARDLDSVAKLGQEVVRRQLEVRGEAHRAGRVSEDSIGAASLAKVARRSRLLEGVEVARAIGMSRQAVAKLEDRAGGGEPEDHDLTFFIAVVLANSPARTEEDLEHVLDVAPARLRRAVADMVARRELTPLMSRSGTSELTFYTLGENGPDLLVDRLDQLAGRRPDTWTVYIALAPGEGSELEHASAQLSGPHRAGVVPKGTVSTAFDDELALTINANTDRDAFDLARDVWKRLRRKAKLPAQEPRIVAFSWPRRFDAGHRD